MGVYNLHVFPDAHQKVDKYDLILSSRIQRKGTIGYNYIILYNMTSEANVMLLVPLMCSCSHGGHLSSISESPALNFQNFFLAK